MKACYNCKHYWQEMKGIENICLREATFSEPSLITGNRNRTHTLHCYEERYGGGKCGKEGIYWEPIE